jgi:hypothetical protein
MDHLFNNQEIWIIPVFLVSQLAKGASINQAQSDYF